MNQPPKYLTPETCIYARLGYPCEAPPCWICRPKKEKPKKEPKR